MKTRHLFLFVLLTLLATGLAAAEWTTLANTAPAALYAEKCGMCHKAGGMGTGILARRLSAEQALLENRNDLQPAYIETVVRTGVGVMFPISRAEVSDAQLQTLTEYLVKEARR